MIKNIMKYMIGLIRWMQVCKLVKKYERGYEGVVNARDWRDLFKRYTIVAAYRSGSIEEFVTEFYNTHFEMIKRKDDLGFLNIFDPVLICAQKNDLVRIKELVQHYRKMGIKHMVFIDNESTDGSREWIEEQDDIDLYIIHSQYTTIRREAWINRMISFYGYNKWYIVVDSDEFLVYSGMEDHPITELIDKCIKNGFNTVRGIMLDMYSDDTLFADGDVIDFRSRCNCFDRDGYYEKPNRFFREVHGGVRERAMDTSAILTKYPIFYFKKGTFEECSHYRFPYVENLTAPCWFGILHYKFIDGKDVEKIKDRVRNGNYANGSEQYKGYLRTIETKNNAAIDHEKTEFYIDSKSLKKVKMITDWR